MGGAVPFFKALMRALYSHSPIHHIYLWLPPIPPMSRPIIFKLPRFAFIIPHSLPFSLHPHAQTIYQYNTTYHTTNHHRYNHHTPDSNHNCRTTSIQPSHVQLHRQTRVRAGHTHTTTSAVIRCDMQLLCICSVTLSCNPSIHWRCILQCAACHDNPSGTDHAHFAPTLTNPAQVGTIATGNGKHTGKLQTQKHAIDCMRLVKLHDQDNHLQQQKAAEQSL